MTVLSCALSVRDAFARALHGMSAKAVAAKIRKIGGAVSARTVEAWKQAKRSPRAEHVMAMLADDTLCPLVLEQVNPAAALQARIAAAKNTLRHLRRRVAAIKGGH